MQLQQDELEKVLKLLEESKRDAAEARKELEVAQAEKKKLEEEASAREASKRKPSDPFSTPEDKIIRSGSAPLSEASQPSSAPSGSEPSAKRRKIQFGISRFFGTPEEKAARAKMEMMSRPSEADQIAEMEAEVEDAALEERDFYRKAGLKGGRPKAFLVVLHQTPVRAFRSPKKKSSAQLTRSQSVIPSEAW